MDRKKRPTLTAPWKIGFLVILMVIVTGLGVSRLITGTFGLRWAWIDLGGLSPTEWTFHLPAFINEMVPLMALILLLALVSYVLVVGAVSRYQRSVATDGETRQLYRSIKTFDDLEDEAIQDSLKQHPELRDFLMGLKNRVAAKERQQQGEREKRHTLPREANEAPPANLASETATLVRAIAGGVEALQNEIALTIPELKQIERVVRERLGQAEQSVRAAQAKQDKQPAAPGPDPASRAAEIALEQVRDYAVSVRQDVNACVGGAREMDKLLASLKKAAAASQDSAVAADGIKKAAQQMDIISDTLVTLSEDTRRIAITAALQASGNGGEDDAIKIAEEVRTIATRFNGVAQTWKEAGPVLRSAIDTVAKGASSAGERRALLVSAAETAANKASLWSERLVALFEQVGELEMAAGVESPSDPAPAPPAPPKEDQEWGEIDAGLTEVDETPSAVEAEPEPRPEAAAAAGTETDADLDDDIVKGTTRPVFDETQETDDEEAQFADIPGFQKEPDVIIEPTEPPSGDGNDGDSDVAIEVDRDEDDWKVKSAADEIQSVASEDRASAKESDDGFLTGPRGKGKPAAKKSAKDEPAATEPEDELPKAPPKKSRREPIPVEDVSDIVIEEPAAAEVAEEAVEEDSDPDAIDLYLYGAVDYVEGVHA